MRITIVQGPYFPVPPILGGAVEKTWFALGQCFAAAGHEVVHLSRAHPSLPSSETIKGVLHHRTQGYDSPSSLKKSFLLDFLYTRRVIKMLPPADIVVGNTFWFPILYRKPRKGLPYIHVARFPKGQLKLFGRQSVLQTVSGAVRDAILAEAPWAANRVPVIPNPLSSDYFRPVVAKRGKTLLYTGRVHPEKGLDLLLEAFGRSDAARTGWHLNIVGPHETRLGGGGDAYMESLRRLAGSLPVSFMGATFETERLLAHYDAASIFIYPSIADKGETFGLAPLEAMARACVPICSDLGCFRDFLQEGQNGAIFDHRGSQRHARLAACIDTLASDEHARTQLATQARKTAECFTLDRVARCYLDDFALRLGQPR